MSYYSISLKTSVVQGELGKLFVKLPKLILEIYSQRNRLKLYLYVEIRDITLRRIINVVKEVSCHYLPNIIMLDYIMIQTSTICS